MSRINVNIGTGYDTNDGDKLRDGGAAINANFIELYALIGSIPILQPTISRINSAILAGVIAENKEVGETYTGALSLTYDRGVIDSKDSHPDIPLTGPETTHSFSGNGINQSGVINAVISEGTNSWSVDQNYSAGSGLYYNSKGDPQNNLDAQRAAGSVQKTSEIITGVYKKWYTLSATPPTTSAGVRALPGFSFEKEFDISIPANHKEVAFYVPANKTLKVVIVENQVDVTGTFLPPTVMNVNDGGGNSVSYNRYETVIGGIGYSTPMTYRVTIN